jgi:hypothetical protein
MIKLRNRKAKNNRIAIAVSLISLIIVKDLSLSMDITRDLQALIIIMTTAVMKKRKRLHQAHQI